MTSSLPYHSTPMQSAVIWDSIFSSDTKAGKVYYASFSPKSHQMFSIYITPKELRKNAKITSDFGFVSEENSAKEITG